MNKVLSYLLALNIFLCYGGICNLCHAAPPDSTVNKEMKANCHSMAGMKHETTAQSKDKSDSSYNFSQAQDSSTLCQYFIPSDTSKISKDIDHGYYISNPFAKDHDNYNFIFDKSSPKIPDRASPTELYIKHSSFLI